MSATGSPATAFALDAPVHEQSSADVVRAEWLKLWSVRSTWWTMAVVVVVMVGFSALVTWAQVATWDRLSPSERSTIDPVGSSLAGFTFGQLAMVVVGVLAITSEFSTGGIRSTLVAVPRRARVVVAKALVVGALALVVGTVASFVAFFVGQAVLATKGLDASLGDGEVLRAVAGAGLYLAACALFGLGVGLIVRSTGGGITIAVAALFIVPPLTALLPGEWGQSIEKYVTSNAGIAIIDTAASGSAGQLGPWAGYAVFTLWWLALVAVGGWLLRRRDV